MNNQENVYSNGQQLKESAIKANVHRIQTYKKDIKDDVAKKDMHCANKRKNT